MLFYTKLSVAMQMILGYKWGIYLYHKVRILERLNFSLSTIAKDINVYINVNNMYKILNKILQL